MAIWQRHAAASTPLNAVERIVAACLPSIGDMLFICILCGISFVLQGHALGIDGDAAWNIRIGEHILAHGLPRSEFLLSSAYGQPTVYWEWLAQVVYGGAYQLGDLNGVVALAGTIAALTGVGLYVALRQRGIPLVLALALTLAATVLTSVTWTARAQLFSLALTLWWSEWLWRYWRDGNPQRLWWFLPVMALWANLHGGFLGGVLLLGTAVGVTWLVPQCHGKANPRHLTLALLATVAATLATPWGPALYTHIVTYAQNPLVTRYTQEYQSPDFHTLSALLFLALALLLAAAWIYTGRRQPAAVEVSDEAVAARNMPEPLAVAHVAIWTTLALISMRFMPLWALIVTPILGETLLRWWRGAAEDTAAMKRGRNGRIAALTRRLLRSARRIEATDVAIGHGVWSALAVLFLLLTLGNGGAIPGTTARIAHARFDTHTFPVQAAQRLHVAGLPAGNGFTTYTWGGYLDLALPEYHPFIDSRSDVYDETLLRDSMAITALQPGWRGLLDRYGIRWALLPVNTPLAQALMLVPGWSCAAADDQGVAALCTRSAPP